MWNRFWAWYQQHYLITLVFTTAIFFTQIFHLYWLATDVIWAQVTGWSAFVFPDAGLFVYILADYLEIPALVSTTLLYVYQFRQRPNVKAFGFILLLNTQWVHILWITDTFVVDSVADHGLFTWNAAVAWLAMLIDYLEVPVIIDTLRSVYIERRTIVARVRASFGAPEPRLSGSIADE